MSQKTNINRSFFIRLIYFISLLYFSVIMISGCKTPLKKTDGSSQKGKAGSYDGSSAGDYYYEDYMKSKNRNKQRQNSGNNENTSKSSTDYSSGENKNKSEKDRKSGSGQTEKKDQRDRNTQDNGNSQNSSKNDNTAKKHNNKKGNDSSLKGDSYQNSKNGTNSQSGNAGYQNNRKNNGSSQTGTANNSNGSNGVVLSDFEKNKLEREKKKKEKEKEAALKKEREEKRRKLLNIETYQFTLKKGNRLKSFGAINGPGKDYHLIQSPAPGSRQYYYLTDRITSAARNPKNVKEKSLDDLKNLIGEKAHDKVKSNASDKNNKGTGFLEIIVLDSVYDQSGKKEVFYNPRFVNIKDMHKGNKLGFALFYNKAKKRTEMIYSAGGNLHRSYTTDGESFSYSEELTALNSEFIERDPAISRDGKILAFASSRKFNSNLMGTQLYISIRDSIYESFPRPRAVKNATNSLNELFPSIYQAKEGTFIIFRKYDKCPYGYNENLYSIRMIGKDPEPMVPFSSESDYAYKYITASYSTKRGIRIMGSYPTNGYDIFRMYVTKKKILMKYALEDDCNTDRIE